MKYLFTIHNKKECYSVKVFQQDNEITARLTPQWSDKTFDGRARNSEPEFDLSKGVRIAVARAKKEYYYSEIEKYKNCIKHSIDGLNEYFGKVEYLDKKYELNRDIRKGCYTTGRKGQFSIISDNIRNTDEVFNTLEAVYTCPSTLLDKTEALDKIMEAYKKYREQ